MAPAIMTIIVIANKIIATTITIHEYEPEVNSALVDAGVAGVDVVKNQAAWFTFTSDVDNEDWNDIDNDNDDGDDYDDVVKHQTP